MTEEELEEYRRKNSERQRKSRELKKLKQIDSLNSSTSKSPGYKCKATRSKAICRLFDKLPNSPTKVKQVVCGLANRVGVQLEQKAQEQIQHTNPKSLTDEVKKIINDFYFRTNLVYTAPGKDDYITVRNKGEKENLRKYYLTVFLREAFCMFKDLHPDIEIHFSKFCSLRPPNVLLLHNTPQEVCKCKTHEDFMYKLKGLGIQYDSNFFKTYLCQEDMESECWKNECFDCKNGKKLKDAYDFSGRECFYKVWEKDENGYLRLMLSNVDDYELFSLIESSWEFVLKHILTKRIQEEVFENDKCNKNVSILQFDFAMAYSCSYQDEIQSALWTRDSVNLFTAALYAKDKPCQSYLVVTDSKDKGKSAVFTFLHELLKVVNLK